MEQVILKEKICEWANRIQKLEKNLRNFFLHHTKINQYSSDVFVTCCVHLPSAQLRFLVPIASLSSFSMTVDFLLFSSITCRGLCAFLRYSRDRWRGQMVSWTDGVDKWGCGQMACTDGMDGGAWKYGFVETCGRRGSGAARSSHFPQSPQFLQSPQFPQFLQSDIQFSE